MTTLTYYPPPATEDSAPAPRRAGAYGDVTPVRHGYTVRDIDRIAATGVARNYNWYAGDIDERHDAARLAVIEHLYATDSAPDRNDLIGAAALADGRYVNDSRSTHGIGVREHGGGTGFNRYWHSSAPHPSHEERIVERIAAAQILPLLTAKQLEAVLALAQTGDYQASQDMLGLTQATLSARIQAARRKFNAAWHEHETPRRIARHDRRLASRTGLDSTGRPRLNAAQLEEIRERRFAGEDVRAIAATYGVNRATIYNLLSGKSKPAPTEGAP